MPKVTNEEIQQVLKDYKMKKESKEPKKSSWSPERRAARSEQVKKRWQDPAYRQMMMDKIAASPRTKPSVSKALIEKWKDPEFREKQSKGRSEGAKRRWADPEKRAALLEARKNKPNNK